MPTYSEALKLFGFKSKNAVSKVFQKFIDEGIVYKDHLGRLMPEKSFDEIPLLGTVKAGIPSTAEDVGFETVDFDTLLVEKKENTFVLEVDGESMIEAHIQDGDLVIVEKANRARNGDIVIAEVDGEWTMKYFEEKNGKIFLIPANKNFKTITPKESFRIGGIVKGVVRKF